MIIQRRGSGRPSTFDNVEFYGRKPEEQKGRKGVSYRQRKLREARKSETECFNATEQEQLDTAKLIAKQNEKPVYACNQTLEETDVKACFKVAEKTQGRIKYVILKAAAPNTANYSVTSDTFGPSFAKRYLIMERVVVTADTETVTKFKQDLKRLHNVATIVDYDGEAWQHIQTL